MATSISQAAHQVGCECTAEDRLLNVLLGVSCSCESSYPKARGLRRHFVCTYQRDQAIKLQPVPPDAICRNSFPSTVLPGFDYFTLDCTQYVPFQLLVSDRSMRFYSDKIRSDMERYLSTIEKRESKNKVRLAIEAKFGKEYWRFPVAAKDWGPKDSNTLKRDKNGSVFYPRVDEAAIESLTRGRSCVEDSLVATIKFVVQDGPSKGAYTALLCEDPVGKFTVEVIYKGAQTTDCRNKFDLVIPGKGYDIRIGDTVTAIVMERKDEIILQIVSEILSSIQRLPDRKLSLALKGSTNGCKWNVQLIRQRHQKLYNWDSRFSFGWRLSVFRADYLTITDEHLSQVMEGSVFMLTSFDQSRSEVELCGPKYYPEVIKDVYPLLKRDVPWHVYNWTTEEVLGDLKHFIRESFRIVEILNRNSV